jgi:hypothetical protein
VVLAADNSTTSEEETLINNCLAVGLLLDRNIISKTGEKSV